MDVCNPSILIWEMGILQPTFLHQWTPLADTQMCLGVQWAPAAAHSHYWEPLPGAIPLQSLEENEGKTFLLTTLPTGNSVRHKDPEGDQKKLKKPQNPQSRDQKKKPWNNDHYERNGLAPFVPLSAPYSNWVYLGFSYTTNPDWMKNNWNSFWCSNSAFLLLSALLENTQRSVLSTFTCHNPEHLQVIPLKHFPHRDITTHLQNWVMEFQADNDQRAVRYFNIWLFISAKWQGILISSM